MAPPFTRGLDSPFTRPPVGIRSQCMRPARQYHAVLQSLQCACLPVISCMVVSLSETGVMEQAASASCSIARTFAPQAAAFGQCGKHILPRVRILAPVFALRRAAATSFCRSRELVAATKSRSHGRLSSDGVELQSWHTCTVQKRRNVAPLKRSRCARSPRAIAGGGMKDQGGAILREVLTREGRGKLDLKDDRAFYSFPRLVSRRGFLVI